MNSAEAIDLLATSRVARLATVRPDGRPHIVPITFAMVGETIVTMIDSKPKTSIRLQRMRNIEVQPAVSVLADIWSENWERLQWVRVDGTAQIHHDGEIWREARASLVGKYPQYRDEAPEGAAIVISIDNVTDWAYNG